MVKVNNNKENKYAKFFLTSKRLSSSQKKLALVRGEHFEQFILTLINDQSVTEELRCLFVTALCGGLRINEALSLKASDFNYDSGELYSEVKVLKKRREDTRTILIPSYASDFIFNFVKKSLDIKLFNISVRTAQREVIEIFNVPGICCHSMRHSAVSFFLDKLSVQETAKLCHVNVAIIDKYYHIDERRTLAKVFKPNDNNGEKK